MSEVRNNAIAPPVPGEHGTDMVQKPVGTDIARRPWESFAIFLVGAGAFSVLGNWMVVSLHVVGFDTLERYSRALMVWHNNPPKLAAIGLDSPPLSTLSLTPLAILRDPVSSLAVIPLSSAIFAGLTFIALNTLMRRCAFITPVRYGILLVIAINPLFAFYASSGRPQMIWVSLFVAAASAIVAWYSTADIRFLLTAGLVFCVAALADYNSLVWFALTALVVATVLSRLGAKNEEIEGTVVGFSTPVVYTVAVWCVLNLLVLTNPVAWLDPGADEDAALGLEEVLSSTWDLLIAAAPIALVILPLLLFRAFAHRDVLAGWLGGSLLLAIAQPGVSAYFGLTDAPMSLGSGLLILVVSIVGGVWLVRSIGQGAQGLAVALAVGLVISAPLTLDQMKTYKYQSLESTFATALTSGESQEGTLTRSRQIVGFDDELAMADYIKKNVTGSQSILTDNAVTFGVILMTGRPELFFDRIDEGDGPWKQAANDPPDRVKYFLLSTSPEDLLGQAYGDAVRRNDPRLAPTFPLQAGDQYRYVLVAVPENFSPTAVAPPATSPSTTDSPISPNPGSTP